MFFIPCWDWLELWLGIEVAASAEPFAFRIVLDITSALCVLGNDEISHFTFGHPAGRMKGVYAHTKWPKWAIYSHTLPRFRSTLPRTLNALCADCFNRAFYVLQLANFHQRNFPRITTDEITLIHIEGRFFEENRFVGALHATSSRKNAMSLLRSATQRPPTFFAGNCPVLTM
jgi:hypothetical protein